MRKRGKLLLTAAGLVALGVVLPTGVAAAAANGRPEPSGSVTNPAGLTLPANRGAGSTSYAQTSPQPLSAADTSGLGANADAPTSGTNPYLATGSGQVQGGHLAGTEGKADNKYPPGQAPGGSDTNKGYECDQNPGIGNGNPAHSACSPSTVPLSAPATTCPAGEVMTITGCDRGPKDYSASQNGPAAPTLGTPRHLGTQHQPLPQGPLGPSPVTAVLAGTTQAGTVVLGETLAAISPLSPTSSTDGPGTASSGPAPSSPRGLTPQPATVLATTISAAPSPLGVVGSGRLPFTGADTDGASVLGLLLIGTGLAVVGASRLRVGA
jgi:hypothetical protein